MIQVAVGVGLVAGAAYFGRVRESGLSAPARTYVERGLDDISQFALSQYPRVELGVEDDPRYRDARHRFQCAAVAPYLEAAQQHLGASFGEEGSGSAAVLLSQAWSVAQQPKQCPNLKMPKWILDL